jgi:hypothetical protein
VSYYEKESQLEYDLNIGFPYIRNEKNNEMRRTLSNLGANYWEGITKRNLDR